MVRCCLFLVIAMASALGVTASDDDVVGILGSQASEIETMTCDFVQTKQMSLLADKLVSYGTMAYRRPGSLRWEYTRPYSYRFIFNGDKVFVGNDDRNSVIDAGSNRIFGQIARIMLNTVTGHIDELHRDFLVEVKGDGPVRVLSMTPKKRELKQLLRMVELTFDEETGVVTHIGLTEKNGDVTDIALSDIKKNRPIDEKIFGVD